MDKALVRLVNVICKRGKQIRIRDSLHKEGVYGRGYQKVDHIKK